MLLLRELATKLSCLLCFRRESGQCVGELWEEHVRAASRFRTPRLSRRRWVGSPATELGEGLHREGGTLFHRSQLRYLNNNHIHCVVCDCRGDYNPGWSEGVVIVNMIKSSRPLNLASSIPAPPRPLQCIIMYNVHVYTNSRRNITFKDILCTKILYNIWQSRLKFYADGAKELVGQISSFCQSSQIPDLSLYHDDHPRQCTCNPPCVYNKVHIIQDWCTQIAQKPGQTFIQWGVMHWVIPRHQCLVVIKF